MGRRHVHFALGLPDRKSSASQMTASKDEFVPTELAGDQDKDKGSGTPDGISSLTLNSTTTQSPQTDAGGEEQVISGMRASADHLVWVDVKRSAVEGGLKWWKSANGVVLTEGDENGVVGLKWVKRVELRATGEVIYTSDGVRKGAEVK